MRRELCRVPKVERLCRLHAGAKAWLPEGNAPRRFAGLGDLPTLCAQRELGATRLQPAIARIDPARRWLHEARRAPWCALVLNPEDGVGGGDGHGGVCNECQGRRPRRQRAQWHQPRTR